MAHIYRHSQDDDLAAFEVFAFVGEDELGSGEIGLKQGRVPAGIVPLVAVRRDKIDRSDLAVQLHAQAQAYGKPIRLVRLAYAETIARIEP